MNSVDTKLNICIVIDIPIPEFSDKIDYGNCVSNSTTYIEFNDTNK